MKRTYILGAIILVCVIGLFIYARGQVKLKSSTLIETATVRENTFIKTVSSAGKTKAQKSVDLKFQTSGKLVWVGVKEGQKVTRGQAIASIDSREVYKTLEKSLRDYSKQRNDFEETWRVTYRGVDNPDEALTDTIKRILQKNQWDLEKAVLDVELKHLSLEYSTLITPIDGIVTHIDTPVAGVNITPATAVFQIIDPSTMQFEAKIDEVDIGDFKIGSPATVILDAYPDATFSGTVTSVAYSAETSSGGATVFPVEIQLSQNTDLRVGFNGDVSIVAKEIPNVLMVPLSAIRESNKQKYVIKKISEKYKKIPVVTGSSNEDEIIVMEGISPGDVVVTKGFTNVVTDE